MEFWREGAGKSRILILTPRPGVNIPAVTTKFVRTKADILKGKNTASPLSKRHYILVLDTKYIHLSQRIHIIIQANERKPIPGCKVESITFFALHSSGFISLISFCLYLVTSCFACSRADDETKSVLRKIYGESEYKVLIHIRTLQIVCIF